MNWCWISDVAHFMQVICKGVHHPFCWWKVRQFQILEQRIGKCRWFLYWLELVHWVLVEDHWAWLVVWVCPKGRRNHHSNRKSWINWDKNHLSESISEFGFHYIWFWHQGEWLHSQEMHWFEIWYSFMVWSKGRILRRWQIFAWCCQWIEHSNF